jgi:hypothetical protein
MLKELKKHKLAYLFLIVGLILGVALFLGSWPDRRLQRLVSIGMATFYILWGILTHLRENRITRRVVLEYLGVGVLAGLSLVLITL